MSFARDLTGEFLEALEKKPLDINQIEALINKYGPDSIVEPKYSLTPLQYILVYLQNENNEVMKLLINKGANIHYRYKDSERSPSVIYYAIRAATKEKVPSVLTERVLLLLEKDIEILYKKTSAYYLTSSSFVWNNLELQKLLDNLLKLRSVAIEERDKIAEIISESFTKFKAPHLAKKYYYQHLMYQKPKQIFKTLQYSPDLVPFTQYLDQVMQLDEKKESKDNVPQNEEQFKAWDMRENLQAESFYNLPSTHYKRWDDVYFGKLAQLAIKGCEFAFKKLKYHTLNEKDFISKMYAAKHFINAKSLVSFNAELSFIEKILFPSIKKNKYLLECIREENPAAAMARWEKLIDQYKMSALIMYLHVGAQCVSLSTDPKEIACLIEKLLNKLKSFPEKDSAPNTNQNGLLVFNSLAALFIKASRDSHKSYLSDLLTSPIYLDPSFYLYLLKMLPDADIELKCKLRMGLARKYVAIGTIETLTKALAEYKLIIELKPSSLGELGSSINVAHQKYKELIRITPINLEMKKSECTVEVETKAVPVVTEAVVDIGVATIVPLARDGLALSSYPSLADNKSADAVLPPSVRDEASQLTETVPSVTTIIPVPKTPGPAQSLYPALITESPAVRYEAPPMLTEAVAAVAHNHSSAESKCTMYSFFTGSQSSSHVSASVDVTEGIAVTNQSQSLPVVVATPIASLLPLAPATPLCHSSLFNFDAERKSSSTFPLLHPAQNPASAPELSFRVECDVAKRIIPLLEKIAKGQGEDAISALYALIDFDIQRSDFDDAYAHLEALFSITDNGNYDFLKLHAQQMAPRFAALKDISPTEQYEKISALRKGIDRALLHAGKMIASQAVVSLSRMSP